MSEFVPSFVLCPAWSSRGRYRHTNDSTVTGKPPSIPFHITSFLRLITVAQFHSDSFKTEGKRTISSSSVFKRKTFQNCFALLQRRTLE
ncbi:hypothetical protein SRHO_G00214770 [Serrasalmus rhombeus]